ncbi:MAG: hypothetical protein ACI9VR_003000 [Cognaticolwellia sp.]|jgi:hypothetical protein
MPISFPESKAVNELFAMLLGKRCKVSKDKPMGRRPGEAAAIGIYVDDAGELVAAVVCDIALAGAAGTALSMLPAKMAKDCIRTKRLPENVAENLYEVLNVGAGLFNSPRTPHVKLFEVIHEPERPSTKVQALLRRPSQRMDLSLEVIGYDKGKIHLLAA